MLEDNAQLGRLSHFVQQMTTLTRKPAVEESEILERGREYLGALIAHDDWLPAFCAEPHPEHYQQYLLHCDPEERFSVVSFVWGPGQKTPVHDHTVWGLVGMLRGQEVSRRFEPGNNGFVEKETEYLSPGEIDAVSPTVGDIHSVANSYEDRVSISIHVYGANIGRVKRHVFDPTSGRPKEFISGYANSVIPNLWRNELVN